MLSHSYNTTMCNGFEYIVDTFNIKIQTTIHRICVYKSHSCLISMSINTIETLIQKSSNDCPLIVLENFNINILDDNNHLKNKLIHYINRFKLKSQFKNITTKAKSQLNHMWRNAVKNEYKSCV